MYFKSLISKCFVFEQLITLSLARSVCTLFRLLFYAFYIPIRFSYALSAFFLSFFVFIYIKNILLYSCVSVIVAVAVAVSGYRLSVIGYRLSVSDFYLDSHS